MPKLLVVVGTPDDSLVSDMCAIHMYMRDKTVSIAKYLTVAKVAREKIYHGHGSDRKVVFDPDLESRFWDEMESADFGDEVKRVLIMLTTAKGTLNDRIIVIILSHANELGQAQMGTELVPIGDLLQPLEFYNSARITIISGTCYSATPVWNQTYSALGSQASNPTQSQVFGHSASSSLAWPLPRSSSFRCRGSFFITHLLKTASPTANLLGHCVETQRLVFENTANTGRFQRTGYYLTSPSLQSETVSHFLPSVSMGELWDSDVEPRGWIAESLSYLSHKIFEGLASLRRSSWDVEAQVPCADTIAYSIAKTRFLFNENDAGSDSDAFVHNLRTMAFSQRLTFEQQNIFIKGVHFVELQDIAVMQRVTRLRKFKRLSTKYRAKKITIRNGWQLIHQFSDNENFVLLATVIAEKDREITQQYIGDYPLNMFLYNRHTVFLAAILTFNGWTQKDLERAYAFLESSPAESRLVELEASLSEEDD